MTTDDFARLVALLTRNEYAQLVDALDAASRRRPLPLLPAVDALRWHARSLGPLASAVVALCEANVWVNADHRNAEAQLHDARTLILADGSTALQLRYHLLQVRYGFFADDTALINAALADAKPLLNEQPHAPLYRRWHMLQLRMAVLYSGNPTQVADRVEAWKATFADHASAADQATIDYMLANYNRRRGGDNVAELFTSSIAVLAGDSGEPGGWIGDELRARIYYGSFIADSVDADRGIGLLWDAAKLSRSVGLWVNVGRALHDIGDQYIYQHARPATAIPIIQQSIALYESALPTGNLKRNHPYYALGVADYYLGNYAGALRAFEHVAAHAKAVPALQASGTCAVGDTLLKYGKYDRARLKFDEALAVLGESADRFGIYYVQLGLARYFLALAQYKLALDTLRPAMAFVDDAGIRDNTAHLLSMRARAHLDIPQQAMADAKALLANLPDAQNTHSGLELRLLIGELRAAVDITDGVAALEAVARDAADHGLAYLMWQARAAMLNAQLGAGDFAAVQALGQQLDAATRQLPELNWQVKHALALAADADDNLALALAHADGAVSQIGVARQSLALPDLSTGFVSRTAAAYFNAIGLAQRGNQPAAALVYAEAYRAQVLAATLRRGDQPANDNARYLQKRQQVDRLRREITSLRKDAFKMEDSVLALHRSERWAMEQKRLMRLFAELKQAYSELRLLDTLDDTAPLSASFDIAAFQSAISAHTGDDWLSLSILVDETADTLWLFVLGPQDNTPAITTRRYSDIAPHLRLAELTTEGTMPLMATRPNRYAPSLTDVDLARRALYRALLPDAVQAWLHDSGTLYIIPSGGLHTLPFTALQAPSGDFLIQQVQLGIAPSLAVLQLLAERQPTPRARLLCLATDEFDGQGRNLRHVVTEEEAIGRYYRRDTGAMITLRNRDVTLARLKAIGSGDDLPADIVHMMSHGQFQDSMVHMSGVMLSDATMLVDDVYDMHIPGALVFLSACEVGLHAAGTGEEWVGLPTALMAAGAQQVVAGLWRMPDRAMASLSAQFYKAMTHSKASSLAALAHSQRHQIALGRPPHDWASLVHFGP